MPELLIVEGFADNSIELFTVLQSQVTWDERMRARKTASFGVAYNYSNITYDAIPMHPLLIPIVDKLESCLGYRPNNCLLNFYPDGDATMGFHSDATEELSPGTGIAIVSLGSSRNITFRNKQDKSIEHAYRLLRGSLLHMSAEVQFSWKHAILVQPDAGARISLTFRQIAPTRSVP